MRGWRLVCFLVVFFFDFEFDRLGFIGGSARYCMVLCGSRGRWGRVCCFLVIFFSFVSRCYGERVGFRLLCMLGSGESRV